MIVYTITNTRYNVNSDGSEGRITFVIWNASYTDQSVTATIKNRGTPIPADYAPADAEYQSITEAEIESWIVDLEDQVSIQNQLDAKVDAIESPQSGSGVPWQNSFPLWVVDLPVDIGYVAIYQNVGYEVVQAHTTAAQWAPPVTPALWKIYVPASEGPQPWVQPIGSTDAYPLGIQVTHTFGPFPAVQHLWTSLVDANVWEPGSDPSLWQDEGAYP